jgi:hypothetical protein
LILVVRCRFGTGRLDFLETDWLANPACFFMPWQFILSLVRGPFGCCQSAAEAGALQTLRVFQGSVYDAKRPGRRQPAAAFPSNGVLPMATAIDCLPGQVTGLIFKPACAVSLKTTPFAFILKNYELCRGGPGEKFPPARHRKDDHVLSSLVSMY